MTQKQAIQLFEDRKVRTVWDDESETWYFSIIDVVGILTDSPDPNNYWKVLKNRLKKEGNETVTICHALKMRASDEKTCLSDIVAPRNFSNTFKPFSSSKPHCGRQFRPC